MHTLIGYAESIDEAGAYANIAAVPDQHMSVNGDYIVVPKQMNSIVATMVYGGTLITNAKLEVPSLEQYGPHIMAPVNQVIIPTGNDVMNFHPHAPVELEPTEYLQCLLKANPDPAEVHSVAVWLAGGEVQPVKGRMRQIGFSVTLAIVAATWNTANVVLSQNMPAGEYTIVGARLECVNGIVARFIHSSSYWRPGFPCSADEDFKAHDRFRYGNFGDFVKFQHDALPQLQILGTAADGGSTYYGVLDILV
jgi:hypothetical protein